jgi:hypothetical protein
MDEAEAELHTTGVAEDATMRSHRAWRAYAAAAAENGEGYMTFPEWQAL